MNKLWTIACLLLPALSFAAGYGGAEGRNRLGERIHIGSDSYHELFIVKGPGDGVWSKPYDMNIHCPEFKSALESSQVSQFSCPPQRHFPLAGATYRITRSNKYRPCSIDPFYDKSPGTVYVCVKGCGRKSVPAQLWERPWEC